MGPGRSITLSALLLGLLALSCETARAQVVIFSTGDPDGLIATGSRPPTGGKLEIETGDDFLLSAPTTLVTGGTFTGLLTGGATTADIDQVVVEVYRVYPIDSDTGRTPNVPTRANSPSDVAFASRDSAAAGLTLTTSALAGTFTANNSVLNGINPSPSQKTGGEGAVTGTEVLFDFTLPGGLALPADHYFFVPQVAVSRGGEFLWLSAPRPIGASGTPFSPDLQTWIRNESLAPDWLRVGTDIVGQGTFNAAFSLRGSAVPEPGTWALLLAACPAAWFALRRHRA